MKTNPLFCLCCIGHFKRDNPTLLDEYHTSFHDAYSMCGVCFEEINGEQMKMGREVLEQAEKAKKG